MPLAPCRDHFHPLLATGFIGHNSCYREACLEDTCENGITPLRIAPTRSVSPVAKSIFDGALHSLDG